MAIYDKTPVYHEDVNLPDGSAAPTAGAFNPVHEAELDGLAYFKAMAVANKCVPVYAEFLANGTFTVPANAATFGFYEGCGGGGAGGLGSANAGTGDHDGGQGCVVAGGAGGGGAIQCSGMIPLIPGESYDVTIGAGGVSVDGLFGIGLPGDDTTCARSTVPGVAIRRCRGADGGWSGLAIPKVLHGIPRFKPTGASDTPIDTTPVVRSQYAFARGGDPVRSDTGVIPAPARADYRPYEHCNTPQAGGRGTSSNWPYEGTSIPGSDNGTAGERGNPSPQGYSGGAGGTPGDNNGIGFYGGGAGGGGGAGPYGNGGVGGDGGDCGVTAAAGTAGTSAAANSGAGGGGGGAAGAGTTSASGAISGSSPGNGGSGRFRIVYFIPAVEPS